MISVDEARARILAPLAPLAAEEVALSQARGRVLAANVVARRTHPPTDTSAMDGYAVRASDVTTPEVELAVVGVSAAGRSFTGAVGAGEAVRIFTGAAVPQGANAIVIQEDVTVVDSGRIRVNDGAEVGQHIRRRGLDVREGEVTLIAGRVLSPPAIGLAAAAGHAALLVVRRPRVAILSTGSELVSPGAILGHDQIVNSNAPMLASLIEAHGGIAIDLGIARDDPQDLLSAAVGFEDADICITIGGASVGDHDLVQPVLREAGLEVDFWKIAMRPGKPLISGAFKGRPFLGLPGNPVSAMVCAYLFLVPMMNCLAGRHDLAPASVSARLKAPMAANGLRQDYVRATLAGDRAAIPDVTPLARQDSSLLSVLAAADALIVRPPSAPAAKPGDVVPIIPLD